MYATSTQGKYWTFHDVSEITALREKANEEQRNLVQNRVGPSVKPLTAAEEKKLCQHYEYCLKEFCGKFKPDMIHSAVGTALAYFKRFYVSNSVMDYHPKDMMLACVYLACKVEEFYVTADNFAGNISKDHDVRERVQKIFLGLEPCLMNKLNYDLTVHNPWRPLEGYLIDLKTRCLKAEEAESLRQGAEVFIDRSLSTDACLLFSPSQIALYAILNTATSAGINLDQYVTQTLVGGDKENMEVLTSQLKRIKKVTKDLAMLDKAEIAALDARAEKCRNQDNNPLSHQYQNKIREEFEEEEEERIQRRTAAIQKQQEQAMVH